MDSERWQHIERLYHSVLEKKVNERAAFLDQACAGDEGLRREVESLLSYEGAAADFIETPALEVAAKAMAKDQSAVAATPLAGQTINQYRIISRLGAGGMGEVYLAEDTRLGRRVALKFLPELLTQDKKHLHRFEQEARAVAVLSHPNVCTIHEVIETADGRHCIVMEYVDGMTLRERMAEGPIKVGEAIDIVIEIASALATAHASGIVHRDIKPENVMLRRDGYVKVLDFGLAKLTEVDNSPEAETKSTMLHTSPGVVMGTVAYMSPEQARGVTVDARSDVWSLGVLLYEMLSGQKPFQGETPTDVIVSIVERAPASLSGLAPEVPTELERIVSKALTKNREGRYPSAADLLSDLKNLKQRVDTGAGKGRRILLVGAAAAVLLAAGFLAARLLRQSAAPASTTAIKSMAVLPLENVSGDASQDYFAVGMTDGLITDLAKIDSIRVMSRPAVMQNARTGKPPPEVGRDLKVDAVLSGSVARSGDRVRISLRLTEVPTARDLWTEDYDRELRDVLTLRREVKSIIAEKIGARVPAEPQISARPVNADAYDQYLRGQFYLNRQTREDNEAAIAALERAVADDPNFAAAYAELAQAYVWKLFLFAPREKRLEEKAFVAVEKALALDDNSAVAYLARGRLLWTPANHFPHEKAITEYRHALALDPSLDEAHNQLALVYSHIGAFSEAIQESQLALVADPNNHLAQFRIGETLNWQGKYEEALSTLRALPREANPELVGYQITWALFNLGRKDEAAALVEQLLKDYPEDNRGLFRSVEAILAASAGHEQIAENNIKSAIERGKGFGHFHHAAYNIACAYALMNKADQALKWLDATAEDGFPCYPLFANDPNLNNIRQDPRFAEFLSKSKQKWEYYKTLL